MAAIANQLTARLCLRIGELLVAERERWVLWLPVLFGGGIGSYFALPAEPRSWAGALAVVLSMALLLGARRNRVAWFQIAAWAALAMSTGFSLAQLRTALVAAPVVEKRIGPLSVEGRITAVELRGKGIRVWLDELAVARLKPGRTPVRARIVLRGNQPPLQAGDRISVRGEYVPPDAIQARRATRHEGYAWKRTSMYVLSVGALLFLASLLWRRYRLRRGLPLFVPRT